MRFHSPVIKPIILIIFLMMASMPLSFGQYSLVMGSANLSSGSKSVRTLGPLSVSSQFSKYGGCLTKRIEETGFFTTAKIDNVWYVVDPDGYLFITSGINSVLKGGGFVLPDSLRKISCNTMGCWSDETINSGVQNKIAYSPRWNMMLNYKNTTQRTKDLYNLGIIPVFDPEFPNYCLQLASTGIAPLKNDPYLFGHFSDNELPVYDNTTYGYLLDRFLGITNKTDPNFIAADSWMKTRRGQGYTVTTADRQEFHGYVTGTYYKIVSTAIKKYDPNHLYLGSRLHGAAKSSSYIFREAGKYVDIISINVYGVWTPSSTDMDMWTNESGRPFLITEFYAKAEDTGLENTDGAGWLVNTQNDRALFFENFVLALIAHPGCIGYHYFKYQDNPTVNTGLLNSSFKWYSPMKESFNDIGKDIYNLRDFLIFGYSGEGKASFYGGTSYKLQAVMLKSGSYTQTELLKAGFDPMSISSVRVKAECVVTLYSQDNFTGDSVQLTKDTPDLTSEGFLKRTQSIRIVDNSVTSVSEMRTDRLKVYPNPFTTALNVEYDDYPQEKVINIYDITGRMIYSGKSSNNMDIINTDKIIPGIYILNVCSRTLNSTTIIIKNR